MFSYRMKTLFGLILLIGMLIINGCNSVQSTSSPPPDPYNGCPEPYNGPFGLREPNDYNRFLRISRDRKFLSYRNSFSRLPTILNLEDRTTREFDISPYLPKSVRVIGSQTISDWCPYADSLILIDVQTETDTNNTGNYIRGYNTYIVSLSGYTLLRATSPMFGLAGSESGSLACWMGRLSMLGQDYIYRPAVTFKESIHYYIVQSDGVEMMPLQESYYSSVRGMYIFFETRGLQNIADWFINGGQIENPGYHQTWVSWSPNERRLALSVMEARRTNDTTAYEKAYRGKEIIIYEFPDELEFKKVTYNHKPLRVINLRKSCCKFSYTGTYSTFITDSTLAVSMHNDGDEFVPLWEINIDGKILRQLTFAP